MKVTIDSESELGEIILYGLERTKHFYVRNHGAGESESVEIYDRDGEKLASGCPGPVTPDMPFDPENHDWELKSDTATCTEDGEKTYKCSRCDETKTENIPAHHTFIAGGCDECGAFEYSETRVKVYVYTFNEEKELNDLGILYYSFEETDKTMNLNDLLHLKPGYTDYTVAYDSFSFSPNDTLKEDLKTQDPYSSYEHELKSSNHIGIIIEPQTN